MPYDSNDDLPEAAKKLSSHAQDAFRQAFNAALKQYGGDEEKAFKVAWSAAKKADGGDDDDSESESRESGWYAAGTNGERPSPYLGPVDRPVRESTVQPQSVRAGITREGRGYRIKDCQIMSAGAGNALHSNVYEPEAIEALVREVQRQPKSFCDHSLPSEVRERGHRSLKDLAGVYDKRTVRYDPGTQACLADLIVRPTVYDEYVAPVLEAGDNLGISVDGIGHCPDRPRHVKGWKRFNSADLVPAGGARGFIVREANTPQEKQAERNFAMSLLDDVTAADVRESAPALFEQIGREYATAQNLRPTGRTETGASSGPPPDQATGDGRQASVYVPKDEGRLSALEAQVREAQQRAEAADARVYELEAEQNRRAVADFVSSMVRECGLTEDKQAAFVAKRFSGATMGPEGTYSSQEALETAVREAAEEFKAVLPQTPSGQIVGLGSGAGGSSGKFQSPRTNDSAIVTSMERLFGAQSVTFPAAAPANGSGTTPSGTGTGGQ
jgi:cation transport regulator